MAHADPTPCTLGTQAQRLRTVMAGLLQDNRDTLAGYPVVPLTKGCWQPSGPGISARGCQLAAVVLAAWLRHLDQALANLRSGSGPLMDSIHRQTLDARRALADLSDCVVSLMAAELAASHLTLTAPAAAATGRVPSRRASASMS